MAKRDVSQEETAVVQPVEMTLEEAKAWRASLAKPVEQVLTDMEKKELFRRFWALNKAKYGKDKTIEEVLWVHLVSMKHDAPELFAQGLEHFGLKKIK